MVNLTATFATLPGRPVYMNYAEVTVPAARCGRTRGGLRAGRGPGPGQSDPRRSAEGQAGGNMAIQIVREPITPDALRSLARGQFGDFVKAVVDVRLGVMAIAGELHADEEGDRPPQGNRSRSVEDPALRQRIVDVVTRLIGP